MVAIRQTSFSSGEMAPATWGRTDLETYQHGLRTCRNFFISQHGAAVSRPGTRYIMGPHFTDTTQQRWLIPYVVSDTLSYVLVFGAGVIQFIRNGEHVYSTLVYIGFAGQTVNFTAGQVVTASGGATATIDFVIDAGATGYIKTTAGFSGPVAVGETLTDPLGGNGVAVAPILDQVTVGPPGNCAFHPPLEVAGTPYTAAEVSQLQYTQSGDVLTVTHPLHPAMELKRISDLVWTFTAVNFYREAPMWRDIVPPQTPPFFATYDPMADQTDYPLETPAGDGSRPLREWTWLISATIEDTAKGITFETVAVPLDRYYAVDPIDPTTQFTMPAFVVLYPDRPVKIVRATYAAPVAESVYSAAYRVVTYNYYRGQGALFGFVGETKEATFIDTGGPPNYAIQPLRGLSPFEFVDVLGVTHTEYPASVAYYQDRLVFGGTAARTAHLFFSATGDYLNFDLHTLVHVSGESLLFALAARRREEIRSLVPLGRLLVFTSSSVWSVGGSGGPIDFNSVDAVREEAVGALALSPLAVNATVLYARTKGQGVRALIQKPANTAQGGAHYTGVDVSLIAQHLFQGATRTSNVQFDGSPSYILRKEVVSWCYAEDPWAMVWAVRGDGVLLSFTFNEQGQVWAWARHDTDGKYLCVCSIPEGLAGEDAVYALVQRTVNGVTSVYVERMSPRVVDERFFQDASLDCSKTLYLYGTWNPVLTGLGHLEGKDVWVTCYGNQFQGPFTVTGGSITLTDAFTTTYVNYSAQPAWVLHVGLLYTCDLETMDLATAAVRMKQKTVTAVGFEVDNAVGLLAGQDFAHLTEPESRDVADSFASPQPTQKLVRAAVNGTWDDSGRAVLRQSRPVPVTVVGITRELDIER